MQVTFYAQLPGQDKPGNRHSLLATVEGQSDLAEIQLPDRQS
jgi:hypothetical protein